MPRRAASKKATKSTRPRVKLTRRKDTTAIEAIALRGGVGGQLEDLVFGPKVPKRQNQRTHYGKTLDLERIEIAIRNAALGHMITLTDIGREGLSMDGHLSGLVQKRFNRATLFDWEVVANDGGGRDDFDHERARKRADFVRRQLSRIPEFGLRLMDMNWAVWDNRSATEIKWLVEPGRELGDPDLVLGWRASDLFWLHARRLSYNQNRDLIVIDQYEGSDFDNPRSFRLDDMPEKFIPYTPRLFGDYSEREGLMPRSLYWSFFQRLGTRLRLQLTEVFSAPWRLAYWDPPQGWTGGANEAALQNAFNILQKMSGQSAGWLPPGVKAQFFQPGAGAGATHKELIDDARFVLSKMIVGATGTTDAVPTGLGSSIGDAHLSEEDLIIATDLYRLAAVIEDRLTDVIIALNYGPEELEYAPKFQFRISALRDRGKELLNIKAALDAGMQIAVEEAYDRAGFRVPRKDEPVLAMVLPAPEAGMPAAAPRPMIVYPSGKAPAPGETRVEPAEALPPLPELEPATPPPAPVAKPAPQPAAPPALPPANPPEPVEGDEEIEASDKDNDEDDDAPKPAFGSPSGVEDRDHDPDDEPPAKKKR